MWRRTGWHGTMTRSGASLIIFSKAPVAGEVKTRLIPELGKERSAELYRQMITRTLMTTIKARISNVYLYCHPDKLHPFFNECADRFDIILCEQTGSNLGKRMQNAIAGVLGMGHGSAILIGCDCPDLSTSDINIAREKLDRGQDIVLGPCEDGGYYLIGMKSMHAELFESVSWGTSSVFEHTRQLVRNLRLSYFELPLRWDIDRPSDLHRLQNDLPDLLRKAPV